MWSFITGLCSGQSVGFSENDALLINVISGAVSLGALVIAIALVDRIGRKPLLWIGSTGMAVTLIALAYAFSTARMVEGSLSLSDSMGVIALLAANAYVLFFNVSWGPIMWVMLGGMYRTRCVVQGLPFRGYSSGSQTLPLP